MCTTSSTAKIRVLAAEPYYGGSHRAVLDQWTARTRHDFEVLTLEARHWKWRMRHAAVSFARQVRARIGDSAEPPWDLVFVSDLLSLAELRGLVPSSLAELPYVLYFHESQLEYPSRFAHQGDLHFAMTNFTSAVAADAVWFNSRFHLEAFFSGTETLLRRMPDHQLLDALAELRERCVVQYPGVETSGSLDPSSSGSEDAASLPGRPPLRIVWAARWEHDKAPERFFAALRSLRGTAGVGEFRVSVLGARGAEVPEVFAEAERELASHIDHWGYVESPTHYRAILASSDVFVSTARHEFFGLSAVEALCEGCSVLLPARLSYPELVEGDAASLYQSEEELVCRLASMTENPEQVRRSGASVASRARQRFGWDVRCSQLDDALEELVEAAR